MNRRDNSVWTAVAGSVRLLTGKQLTVLFALSAATLVSNVLDVVAIAIVGAVGTLAVGGSLESSQFFSESWLAKQDEAEIIFMLLGLAALIFLVKTVLGVFLAKARADFLAALEVSFAKKIARSVFSGDLATVRAYSRSQIEWAILRSTEYTCLILGSVLSIFAEATLSLLIVGFFIYYDWSSAIVILIYFGCLVILFQRFANLTTGQSGTHLVEGAITVDQAIGDLLTAFKEASVLTRIPFFLRKINESRRLVARARAMQTWVSALPRLFVELALIFGAIGFLVFEFSRTGGEPDFGLIAIFLVGGLRMMSALLPLQRSYMDLRFVAPQARQSQEIVKASLESARRLSEVEADIDAVPSESLLSREEGLSIEISDLSFAYRDKDKTELVLSDVTLDINPGSTVAFIGPSGAGKSTLIDLILGLHSPATGRVLCSGLDPKEIRSLHPGIIGYVPQRPGLVTGTLRENIALGVPIEEIDEHALRRAITLAQLDDFIGELTEGVDSLIGQHGDSLSGGQAQRLGLARALYTWPKLIVLDEATSALDAETEAGIATSLDKLRGKTTVLVVAHRLSTVQNADRVFVIDGGKIAASGTLKELRESVPLVKKYIDLMTIE